MVLVLKSVEDVKSQLVEIFWVNGILWCLVVDQGGESGGLHLSIVYCHVDVTLYALIIGGLQSAGNEVDYC